MHSLSSGISRPDLSNSQPSRPTTTWISYLASANPPDSV